MRWLFLLLIPSFALAGEPTSSFTGEYHLNGKAEGLGKVGVSVRITPDARGQLRVERIVWSKQQRSSQRWTSASARRDGEALVATLHRQGLSQALAQVRSKLTVRYTLAKRGSRLTERVYRQVGKRKRRVAKSKGRRVVDQLPFAGFSPRLSGWVDFHRDDRFQQRYRIDGKKVWTETITWVAASPVAVRAEISKQWDWWRKGRIRNRQRLPDGRVVFQFWPARYFLNSEELTRPFEPIGGGAQRMRFDIRGNINGPGSIDVIPLPLGGSLIVSRFHGVEGRGVFYRVLGAKGLAKNHLRSERGKLPWPLPKGTGWLGLFDRLERRADG